MSKALYPVKSLRFYTEEEIDFRDMMTKKISATVRRTLQAMNKAWRVERVEGPLLTPRNYVSDSYDENDIFITQIIKAEQQLVLRPETTASSYIMAREVFGSSQKQLPLCVWQAAKSFRVEKADGASASKLRFNEFYQLEFQCIYSDTTKADYRSALISAVSKDISMFLFGAEVRSIEQNRIPSYSESTIDLEAMYNGSWKEIASCSIRKDFADDCKVCEIAIGLDRLVEMWALGK
jgi:glycyl-tRNA synthetase (class II)